MIGSLAAAALLAAVPAQGSVDDSLPVRTVRVREMTATIAGGLAVTFRGDPATGCAGAGLCGVEGTVTWTPGGGATLIAGEFEQRGRRRTAGALTFNREPVVASNVSDHGKRCVDAQEAGRGILLDETSGGLSLTVPGPRFPLGGDVLRTRCAGPLQADLLAALPTRALSRAVLRRGRTTLDLRGERPFAAGGLAGTVRSTLVARLNRPAREGALDRRAPQRYRMLTVTYALERLTGAVTTTFAGLADPALCGPLDACGVSGTVTATPGAPLGTTVTLVAWAAGGRPWRDLRAALGLSRRRWPTQVYVSGGGRWQHGTGTVTTSVERTDGRSPCHDTRPLTGGALQLDTAPAELTAGVSWEPDPLVTRCPGPRLLDLEPEPDDMLAAGRLPRRAAGRRHLTLRLTRTRDFESDGYTGRTRADLTVVLRRLRIRRGTVVADR